MKLKIALLIITGLLIMSCGDNSTSVIDNNTTSNIEDTTTKITLVGNWQVTKQTKTIAGTAVESDIDPTNTKTFFSFDTDSATALLKIQNPLSQSTEEIMIFITKGAYSILGDTLYLSDEESTKSYFLKSTENQFSFTEVSDDTVQITELTRSNEEIPKSGLITLEELTKQLEQNDNTTVPTIEKMIGNWVVTKQIKTIAGVSVDSDLDLELTSTYFIFDTDSLTAVLSMDNPLSEFQEEMLILISKIAYEVSDGSLQMNGGNTSSPLALNSDKNQFMITETSGDTVQITEFERTTKIINTSKLMTLDEFITLLNQATPAE